MKVRMLCNPARSLGCKLMEGETGDVPNHDGDLLIQLGIAEKVLPEIKAVEPEMQAEVQKPKVRPAKPESITPTSEK